MDLERYKREMGRLKAEREELQRMVRDIDLRQRQEKDSHSALEHLERFCSQVATGLEAMTFGERQQLLRLVVERITVEDGRVRVETIIPTGQDDVKLRKQRGELVELCRGPGGTAPDFSLTPFQKRKGVQEAYPESYRRDGSVGGRPRVRLQYGAYVMARFSTAKYSGPIEPESPTIPPILRFHL